MDRQIIDYLPGYLKEYKEFQGISGMLQSEFDDTWKTTDFLLQESFVTTAESYGLSKWEEFLGIARNDTTTTEDRRFQIIAQLQNQTPYTYRRLVQLLTNLCGKDGYKITLDANDYTLTVLLAISRQAQFDAVESLLKEIIPANLVLTVSLEYNRHSLLAGFTHAELTAYTHNQLRNEELT